jgi:hypothetical protein
VLTQDLARDCNEAADLAQRYNWPEEAKQLRLGKVPEGFGREVGENVALFMKSLPHLVGSREKYEQERQEARAHGKQLARLRLLVAHISLAQRVEETLFPE